MLFGHRPLTACATALLLGSLTLTSPTAAFPGDNGRFAVTMPDPDDPDDWMPRPQVWTMNEDGTGFRQQFAALEEANSYPVWSPDGDWLAFYRGGSMIVARADGSSARIVTTGAYGYYAWSPDGTRLLFVRSNNNGTWSLWMVGADGTDEHLVYRGGYLGDPAWSPLGDRIAFRHSAPSTDYQGSRVFTMDTDGTDLQQVTFHAKPDWPFQRDSGPEWSPDGQRLVFISDRDAPAACSNCPLDLYVVDAAGGSVQRLARPGDEHSPTWSPDGGSIAYVSIPTPPFHRDDPMWFDRYDLGTSHAEHIHAAELNSTIDWAVAPGSVPHADLGTTVTVADPASLRGASTSVTATTTNHGPEVAQAAAVEVRLPPGVRPSGATTGCTGTEPVVCEFAAMQPGESRSVTVDVDLDEAGVGEVSARAISRTPDTDVLDNRSATSLAVCTALGDAGPNVVLGTDGDDVLCGGGGDDELDGSGGDDVLLGGAGADMLEGGSGADTVSYAVAGGGARVNLATGESHGEGTDTLATIESAVGSARRDVLVGNARGNRLVGGAGADRVVAGAGRDQVDGGTGRDRLISGLGDDVVLGGRGTDTISFAGARRAVTINLSRRYSTGEGEDVVKQVENILGTRHADSITGSVITNLVVGGRGRDTMVGRGGDDRVAGGGGDDDLNGGDGVDRLRGGTGHDHCEQRAGRGTSSSCES